MKSLRGSAAVADGIDSLLLLLLLLLFHWCFIVTVAATADDLSIVAVIFAVDRSTAAPVAIDPKL